MGIDYLDPKQNKNKQPTSVSQYHQHNEGGSQFYWPHNQVLQTGSSYHGILRSNQGGLPVQQASSNHRRALHDSGRSFEGTTASALHPYALLNTSPLSSGFNFNTALTQGSFGNSHLHTSGHFLSAGGTSSNGYASARHGTNPNSFGSFGNSHLHTSGDFQSLEGTPSNDYASARHGIDPNSFGSFRSSHLHTSGDFLSLGGTPSTGYASASHGTDPSSFGSFGGIPSNGHASTSHGTDPSSYGVWQGFSQQQSNHMPVHVPAAIANYQPPVNGMANGALEFDSGEYTMLTAKLQTCMRDYQHDTHNCLDVHTWEQPRRDPSKYNYSAEKCKNFVETGSCRWGDECPNAHGVYEVGFHHMIYRRNYCWYGPYCHRRRLCFFAHSQEELRDPKEHLVNLAVRHRLRIPVGSCPQVSEASGTAEDTPPGSTLSCALCAGGIMILSWNNLRQFPHDTNHAHMPCGHYCHRDCLEEAMKKNVGPRLPCNRCSGDA